MTTITVVSKFVKHAGYATLGDLWQEIRNPKLAEDFKRLRASYQAGRHSEYKAQKEDLIAFIITGMYDSPRHPSSLTEYSRMMILDFDHLGNKLEAVREAVTADIHTLACFLSPSGDGLKAIVKVDSRPEDHKDMYRAVAEYYEDVTGVEPDSTGCNINRLCFISYDPDLYVNEQCEQFKIAEMVHRVRQMELF